MDLADRYVHILQGQLELHVKALAWVANVIKFFMITAWARLLMIKSLAHAMIMKNRKGTAATTIGIGKRKQRLINTVSEVLFG